MRDIPLQSAAPRQRMPFLKIEIALNTRPPFRAHTGRTLEHAAPCTSLQLPASYIERGTYNRALLIHSCVKKTSFNWLHSSGDKMFAITGGLQQPSNRLFENLVDPHIAAYAAAAAVAARAPLFLSEDSEAPHVSSCCQSLTGTQPFPSQHLDLALTSPIVPDRTDAGGTMQTLLEHPTFDLAASPEYSSPPEQQRSVPSKVSALICSYKDTVL